MGASVLNEEGEQVPIIMGSYGIGVERIITAAVEQRHDEDGIIWPKSLTPFHVVVTITNMKQEELRAAGEKLYSDLQRAGLEVLLDDRDERAGVKFKDADLIGIPYRITIGPGPPTICHGDSGGAVLLDGAVIGIHSRSDCDFLNLAERVDAHTTLIDDFVADHPPDAGGCSAASARCLSPVACCLFAGLLLTRRRGSARPARRAPPAPPAA